MRQIILASNSPRRKELLKNIGLKFKIEKSNSIEKVIPGTSPNQAVKQLAEQKAMVVAQKYKNAIVIAADTMVILGDEILGKPKTKSRAIKMLKKLNGKTHLVFTGFTIIDTKTKKKITKVVKTKIHFNKLTDSEIKNYVATKEPLDKAGAYAIQGKGMALIKKIQGNYFNVIGLPVTELINTLKEFEVKII